MTRSGPGLSSIVVDASSASSLPSVCSPHGPFLMPVEGDRGSGQVQRLCDCIDGIIDRNNIGKSGHIISGMIHRSDDMHRNTCSISVSRSNNVNELQSCVET